MSVHERKEFEHDPAEARAVPPVRVTVLMTLYNKGEFVEEALQSVLASTFTDLELLVVDDASTDGGMEKARAISDPRIRVLESRTNTGRAAAANRGYDAARGEYVAVLDADDRMMPDRLATQVAFMDAHPEVGVCGSAVGSFGAQDTIYRWPSTDAEIRARDLFGIPASYGACILRRSVLEAHGLRCPENWRTPGMDHLFLVTVGRHTHYANLEEVLIEYRTGGANMRHGRDEVRDQRLLFRALLDLHGIPATDEQVADHAWLAGIPDAPLDARTVRRVHAWSVHLETWNKEHGVFPAHEFRRELRMRFDRMFFPSVEAGFSAGWTHYRSSGDRSTGRLVHLCKRSLLGMLGRSRR